MGLFGYADMKQTLAGQFDEKFAALVRRVSAARGETISSFLRRSVKRELAALGLLPDEERRALGIRDGEPPP